MKQNKIKIHWYSGTIRRASPKDSFWIRRGFIHSLARLPDMCRQPWATLLRGQMEGWRCVGCGRQRRQPLARLPSYLPPPLGEPWGFSGVSGTGAPGSWVYEWGWLSSFTEKEGSLQPPQPVIPRWRWDPLRKPGPQSKTLSKQCRFWFNLLP